MNLNGKIYKLVSLNDPSLVYYGSTIQSLKKRKSSHYYQYKSGKIMCTSSKLFELGDVEIYLVENFPCENRKQLRRKEGEYILNNKCVNVCVPGRTRSETLSAYYQKNKSYYQNYYSKNSDYYKNYYIKNKVKCEECNVYLYRNYVKKHKQSKKHQKNSK